MMLECLDLGYLCDQTVWVWVWDVLFCRFGGVYKKLLDRHNAAVNVTVTVLLLGNKYTA